MVYPTLLGILGHFYGIHYQKSVLIFQWRALNHQKLYQSIDLDLSFSMYELDFPYFKIFREIDHTASIEETLSHLFW